MCERQSPWDLGLGAYHRIARGLFKQRAMRSMVKKFKPNIEPKHDPAYPLPSYCLAHASITAPAGVMDWL